MAKIKKITAKQILDGTGTPTIQCDLITSEDKRFTAYASSGKSIGKYEGIELRDKKILYNGMGVNTAVEYINNLLAPKLIDIDINQQQQIDNWLVKADGTNNCSKLGINSLSVISQLLFKARSDLLGLPYYAYATKYLNEINNTDYKITSFPTPIYTLINGGKHGAKNLDFQEFQIIFTSITPYQTSLEYAVSTFKNLETIFRNKNYTISVSQEGGYTPNLYNNTEAFELIKESLLLRDLKLSVDVFCGIDCASSFYYKNNKFYIKESSGGYDLSGYLNYLYDIIDRYNIILLEDPLPDDKFDFWKKISPETKKNIYIIADDLVAGNIERLKKVIKEDLVSGVVVKFNQIATITQLFQVINLLKSNKLKIVFSQRLGETIDSLIADISIGIGADYVKFGPPNRGERVIKYNRLLELNEIK